MMRTRVLFVIGIPFACVIFLMLFINTDLKRKVYKITSFETTSKPRVNSSFLDSLYTQPTDQSRTSPAINNMPTSPLQENYNLKRKFCSMKFENGEMCPPLYTDLGGQCGRNGSGFLYCEDVRRLGSQSLRQAQLAITRLLGLFDNIARKYNVTYWITSATLLGAARHKGFIPWDSDADIEIPLDEYEKFFRNGSADLPKDVFFQNTESDHELRPPAQTYEAHKYKDIGMYIRTWNPRIRDRKSCYKYCIANGCKWNDGLMVDIYVVESVPEGSYPLKELIFEGISLPVQNNWKDVLKGKYGADYMEVPKEGYKNRQQWDWPDPDHSCEELQSN